MHANGGAHSGLGRVVIFCYTGAMWEMNETAKYYNPWKRPRWEHNCPEKYAISHLSSLGDPFTAKINYQELSAQGESWLKHRAGQSGQQTVRLVRACR